MKRLLKSIGGILMCSLLLTSCYTYTTVVGEGAQGNREVTEWNHYVVYGLAPVGVSDAKKMAGDAENYTVTTQLTFVNGLIAGITLGIYTPTTTTVTK
ncbi:Bor family protein [Echinicola jeungdonensis]|uniref:Bor family protein n=1 Tax=Echinicola jeungdonensis TaxID=709343 RepID=A0ABV5J731_9BACT|nr:Bor family protein [Echinicola jeungdonensis]MDN3669263.1 Bor family protein [Echinicola jeungdonensis]